MTVEPLLGHHHPWLVRGHPRVKDLPELGNGRFVHVSPVGVDLREDTVLIRLEDETGAAGKGGKGLIHPPSTLSRSSP